MAWITDNNCSPDQVMIMSPSQYKAYQRLGYATSGVLWEPGINALEVAMKGGWMLTGSKVQDGDTIWYPTLWTHPPRLASSEDEKDGWVRLLENSLSGCPVAYKAMCDVVRSNGAYSEYRETVDVLGENFDA